MPLTLDTAIDVQTTDVMSVGEIQVGKIEIDDLDFKISFVVYYVTGEQAGQIIGKFTIVDLTEETEIDVGGKVFTVSPGNYFTDICAAAPVGASNYVVIKNACYAVLGTMYGLTGTIT